MTEPLRFYQIPWSHYCDKVRWALDIKELPYEAVNYNPLGFTRGLQRAPKTMCKLLPILEDPNDEGDNTFRCESTDILIYLDTRYPRISKALFPSSSEDREEVIDACLHFDSTLGLYVRRLAYVQLLNEKPSIMSIVAGEQFPWAYNPDDIRSYFISIYVTSCMIGRYRLHRIREDRLREKAEEILLEVGNHLRTNEFLVGKQFSAADVTFCSLVRPLGWIPYFSNDPRFRVIFDYHKRIRQDYDPKYPNIRNIIDKLLDKSRQQKKDNEKRCITYAKRFFHRINLMQRFFVAFMVILVSFFFGPTTDDEEIPEFKSSNSDNRGAHTTFNDQRLLDLSTPWSKMKFVFKYYCHMLFTIPELSEYLDIRA